MVGFGQKWRSRSRFWLFISWTLSASESLLYEKGVESPYIMDPSDGPFPRLHDTGDLTHREPVATSVVRGTDETNHCQPILNLHGPQQIFLHLGDSFQDPGVSCTVPSAMGPARDITGRVEKTVEPSSGVSTAKDGTYVISYFCDCEGEGVPPVTIHREVVVFGSAGGPPIEFDGTQTQNNGNGVPHTPFIKLSGSPQLMVEKTATNQFIDEGAVCLDVDGTELSDNIITENSVDLRVPGEYQIVYECQNHEGVQAPSVVRVVKVVENIILGCANITIQGQITPDPLEQLNKHYLQLYSYCIATHSGKKLKGKDHRCIAIYNNRPVYRESRGTNILFFYHMEANESQKGSLGSRWRIRDLRFGSTHHIGLEVTTKVKVPEDIEQTWVMVSQDGSRTFAPNVGAKCGERLPVEIIPPFEYKLEVAIQLLGIQPTEFNLDHQQSFHNALMHLLHVNQDDVIIHNLQDLSTREYGSGALVTQSNFGSDHSILVEVKVLGAYSKLHTYVEPKLKSSGFAEFLKIELQLHGIPVSGCYVDPNKVQDPHITGRAVRHRVVLIFASLCAMGLLIEAYTLCKAASRVYRKQHTKIIDVVNDTLERNNAAENTLAAHGENQALLSGS